MTTYAKLNDGVLTYAPDSKGNVLGYNLESNHVQLLNDGYKPVEKILNKEKYTDCEGTYLFHFEEKDDKIVEMATYQPYGYAFLRKNAYPDMSDLCDALVKINSNDDVLKSEGEKQLSAYVQTCLDVKQKYPKP